MGDKEVIIAINIHTDREQLIVHLAKETDNELFWLVPKEDDGSDKWSVVQTWLDEGNSITDTLNYKSLYQGERLSEYPPIGDQLDALFHAGVFPQEMADKIQAVKDAHPKPTGE